MNNEKIREIEKYGIKAKGRTEPLKHLNDEKIGRTQAMSAKCYECSNYFADGRVNCEIPDCPLYPWMNYRHSTPPDDPTDDSSDETG